MLNLLSRMNLSKNQLSMSKDSQQKYYQSHNLAKTGDFFIFHKYKTCQIIKNPYLYLIKHFSLQIGQKTFGMMQ